MSENPKGTGFTPGAGIPGVTSPFSDEDAADRLVDGRDIELSEANKVFEHINDLWGGEVKFTTIIEDDTWEF